MEKSTRARRGRPELTADQREAMRQRIAMTAQRLFHEEGYAAVSMRRLASELGVTPMTLYAYFDAKIDILRQLWSHIFESVFAELDKVARRHRDPRRQLVALSLAYVDYWLRNPEHYRMVFMTEGVAQSDVSVFVEDAPVVARFGVLLRPLARLCKGESAGRLKARADLLMSGLHGIAHCRITISAYSWSRPDALVSLLITGIIGTSS